MTAAVAPAYQMWQNGSFLKKWGITKNPYDGWIPLRRGGTICQEEPTPSLWRKEQSQAWQGSTAQPATALQKATEMLLTSSFSKGPHSGKVLQVGIPAKSKNSRVQQDASVWSLNRTLSSTLPFELCFHGLPVHLGVTWQRLSCTGGWDKDYVEHLWSCANWCLHWAYSAAHLCKVQFWSSKNLLSFSLPNYFWFEKYCSYCCFLSIGLGFFSSIAENDVSLLMSFSFFCKKCSLSFWPSIPRQKICLGICDALF